MSYMLFISNELYAADRNSLFCASCGVKIDLHSAGIGSEGLEPPPR